MAVNPTRPKGPPLNALRAFEAAARHQSFVLAAQELGVSPGAVSQHIKTLEALTLPPDPGRSGVESVPVSFS